ncbi:MAG: SDR family oxidoreductase [Limosilactobacillus sp.]|uniref:NAD(P)H-binding protein n=1 Tax=Limosilactobacillus sp. TaxID=2773925 RepID=UPI0025BC0AD1|nr:NAD(P)H-binding protein [Limosilactobacillus sp.]MCI1975256.1 SDR family oxidoreductase [Limosilactobacillus sp.]MCI2030709.1 SDR family oxidoreductase [Limosilactobacillus sp.]
MSKIFVAGGSGRVATELIKDLVSDGNQVVAGARRPEKITNLEGVSAVKLDLHAEVNEIAKLMNDCDVVYFVAGSRGNDLLQTDAFGAVKTMMAAEKDGIKRYVMLSSMYALQPEMWTKYKALAEITDYNIAKFFADNYLIHNTDLAYTIVQPATLTEEPGTGLVTLGAGGDTTNPIPDVAKVLANTLKHENTIGKVIMMRSGKTPIDDALSNLND